MPFRAVPERWKVPVVGFLWERAMRLETSTWRRRVIGRAVIDDLASRGERALVVLWHGHYRPVLACVRDRPCWLVSTATYRGRIIREAARRLGHHCVLRPPELRGKQAVEWLHDQLKDATRIVLVADGPSGPARRVKRGVVELAARLRLRMVPCATASRWAFERERWDHQEIPLPLSRVAVVIGQALPALAESLPGSQLAAWRRRAAAAIDDCRREALARVGRLSNDA